MSRLTRFDLSKLLKNAIEFGGGNALASVAYAEKQRRRRESLFGALVLQWLQALWKNVLRNALARAQRDSAVAWRESHRVAQQVNEYSS